MRWFPLRRRRLPAVALIVVAARNRCAGTDTAGGAPPRLRAPPAPA
ncbi:MAG TPA: hypothetical protein VHL53_18485 [Acidimicrobiia bacterium]|nr:hypothetical protein [Acidimicrobiia bacterium]